MFVVEYRGRSKSFPGLLGAITHTADLYESQGVEGQDCDELTAELFDAACLTGGATEDGITVRMDAIGRETVKKARVTA